MEEIVKENLIKDKEHLKLLSIFHVIYGILTVGFSLLFIFYAFIMHSILGEPNLYSRFPRAQYSQMPPQQIFQFVTIILTIMIIIGCLIGISNILSAYYIKKRKLRVFSIIIAAIDCISFPFGTILGVFTLIVLFRNSVKELYKPAILNEDTR